MKKYEISVFIDKYLEGIHSALVLYKNDEIVNVFYDFKLEFGETILQNQKYFRKIINDILNDKNKALLNLKNKTKVIALLSKDILNNEEITVKIK